MSNDSKRDETGGTAPRLAAAMAEVRATRTGSGQGTERARLGRIGGGRRPLADEHDEQHDQGDENVPT